MLTSIALFKPSRSRNWYIQYTNAEGIRKQKSTGCSIRRDALKVLTELKETLKEKPRIIMFSKLTEQFLEYAGNIYPSKTFEVYKASLKDFFDFK